jgi:hypothetical protein
MKHFSKELAEYLAGPPRLRAYQFAQKCGMTKSKMSRILSDSIDVSRDTLDAMLDALPQAHAEWRTRLVAAYIRDLVSPGAMLCLKSKGTSEWGNLQIAGLSPKGEAALKALVQSDHVRDVEKILINLAVAFGLHPKP